MAEPVQSESWPSFVAGSAGGVADMLLCHPILTFKVRSQAHMMGEGGRYRPRATLAEFLSLYQGLTPAVSRGALAGALSLGTNQYFKALFSASDHEPLSMNFLAAATATGMLESIVYSPIELATIQMQMGLHNSATQCAKDLYRSHGLRGLYMGFTPFLTSNIFGNLAFFVSYGWLQRQFGGTRDGLTVPGVAGTTVAAGTAGALSYLAGQPADTVQAVMMAQRRPREQFPSARACVQEMLAREGWRALFRGLTPNLVAAVPGISISMVVFEAVLPVVTRLSNDSEGPT